MSKVGRSILGHPEAHIEISGKIHSTFCLTMFRIMRHHFVKTSLIPLDLYYPKSNASLSIFKSNYKPQNSKRTKSRHNAIHLTERIGLLHQTAASFTKIVNSQNFFPDNLQSIKIKTLGSFRRRKTEMDCNQINLLMSYSRLTCILLELILILLFELKLNKA